MEDGGCPLSASPSLHVTASCIDCLAGRWRGSGWWKGGLGGHLSRMLYWSLTHPYTRTHTQRYKKVVIAYRKRNQAIFRYVSIHFVGSSDFGLAVAAGGVNMSAGMGWEVVLGWLYHWPPDFCRWPVGLLIKWGFCSWAPPRSGCWSAVAPPLELNRMRWRHFHERPSTTTSSSSFKLPLIHRPLHQATPPFCFLPPLSLWRSAVPFPRPCPFLTSVRKLKRVRTPARSV